MRSWNNGDFSYSRTHRSGLAPHHETSSLISAQHASKLSLQHGTVVLGLDVLDLADPAAMTALNQASLRRCHLCPESVQHPHVLQFVPRVRTGCDMVAQEREPSQRLLHSSPAVEYD